MLVMPAFVNLSPWHSKQFALRMSRALVASSSVPSAIAVLGRPGESIVAASKSKLRVIRVERMVAISLHLILGTARCSRAHIFSNWPYEDDPRELRPAGRRYLRSLAASAATTATAVAATK